MANKKKPARLAGHVADAIGCGAAERVFRAAGAHEAAHEAAGLHLWYAVACSPAAVERVAASERTFAALRAFDDQGVKLIWIETPPATPEWEGVRDRLQRAAAA